ncbi:MAG: M23 family metallopeptidase [Candidatus Eremiobacteraeota bacterium]|nr:M23 family metallopeptidase [Candidatus Eremiobacteraeota bacterium]
MKRWILWVSLMGAATAESRLQQLLDEQRKSYGPAVVTSGFHDARGVSRYRSRPGVHSGYDIAMPAGASVRAAWSGQVRAIIPWADGEWGVEVVLGDGTSATYGHVVPGVSVGQRLEVGQTVGSVARDHVDVKMRDAQGTLFDYAGGVALISLPPAPPRPSPRALAWQQRWRRLSSLPLPQLSGVQQRQLRAAGLSLQAGKAEPGWDALFKEWSALSQADRGLLSWTKSDQEEAGRWQSLLEEDRLRYEHGLIARKKLGRTEECARRWKRVLGS